MLGKAVTENRRTEVRRSRLKRAPRGLRPAITRKSEFVSLAFLFFFAHNIQRGMLQWL